MKMSRWDDQYLESYCCCWNSTLLTYLEREETGRMVVFFAQHGRQEKKMRKKEKSLYIYICLHSIYLVETKQFLLVCHRYLRPHACDAGDITLSCHCFNGSLMFNSGLVVRVNFRWGLVVHESRGLKSLSLSSGWCLPDSATCIQRGVFFKN